MNTCWYNEHASEIEGKTPEKYGHHSVMCRPPIAGCPCGMHKWNTIEERQLKALKCLEHQHLKYINCLRGSQWTEIESRSDLKNDSLDHDNSKVCKAAVMKPPEKYPVILSPYSLCWWEQPDPVIPPLTTGLISRYGYKYRLPNLSSSCGHYKQLHLKPIIHPAKRPTFDKIPKCMDIYWDNRPGRTEYEDSFSHTGYVILRGAKQYAEPIPSSRRIKYVLPF